MKRVKIKWTVFLQAAVCAAALVCGCSALPQDDAQKEEVQEEEKTELSVWAFFDENTPGTYYVDLWEELAAEYGYEIDLNTYTTEQIQDKLNVALVGNELPDVFAVWGGNYPNFLFDANACVAVEDYLQEADFTFKESYVQPYSDGHNYIIPCLVEAYGVMYCNNDLMEEIGLTVPSTWEELVRLVEQVNVYNEENGTSYAAMELGDKDSWLGELLYMTIVNRIDPYAQDKLADGSIDFSDAVFAEATDKLMQLEEIGAFPEKFLETGEVEAVRNFAQGEAVLFPHQSTIVYHLIDEMGEDAVSMAQFPSCNAEYDNTYTRYMVDINHTLTPGLCISANSRHPDEAAALCLEFARRVNERNVTEYNYVDLIEDSQLVPAENSPKAVEQFHAMLDEAEKFTPLWYAVLDKEDGDNWRNLTRKLLGHAITRDEFLESAAPYLNFTTK